MVVAIVLGLLGLILGPWLGILVDRAVDRERLVADHRCPECGSSLGRSSLVPIRHWFLRCGVDPAHRRTRYVFVDVATVAAFALAGVRFGWNWQLGPYLALFAALVVMSVIDFETHLLLNVLTYPSLFVGIFLVLALSGPTGTEDRIWPALIGAAVYGGVLGVAFLAYPPGLGLGDVKLAPTLGLFVGWLSADELVAVRLVLYAMIVAFLLGGLTGVGINIATKRSMRAEIPMGPFLALGAAVIIAVSSPSATDLLTR